MGLRRRLSECYCGAHDRDPREAQELYNAVEFAPILADLIAETPVKRSAGSDAEHMIRVLKAYGFLAPNTGSGG
jgi:hypothetical protein